MPLVSHGSVPVGVAAEAAAGSFSVVVIALFPVHRQSKNHAVRIPERTAPTIVGGAHG